MVFFLVNKDDKSEWLSEEKEALRTCSQMTREFTKEDFILPWLARVQCSGIPVQAWVEANLKAFTKNMGDWVSWCFQDEENLKIHSPVVTLVTNMVSKISENLTIMVHGKNYEVAFIEMDTEYLGCLCKHVAEKAKNRDCCDKAIGVISLHKYKWYEVSRNLIQYEGVVNHSVNSLGRESNADSELLSKTLVDVESTLGTVVRDTLEEGELIEDTVTTGDTVIQETFATSPPRVRNFKDTKWSARENIISQNNLESGLGACNSVAPRFIKEAVKENKVTFLCLQETKCEAWNKMAVEFIWSSQDFGWVEVKSRGLSCGLLCVWNSSLYTLVQSHNTDSDLLSRGASILGCKVGSRNLAFWDPLMAKVQGKLASWKSESLNKAGRLVLLKAAIDNQPLYWFNTYLIPKEVCSRLENIRRSFLWGKLRDQGARIRKLHLINRGKITLPKEKGGLGVDSVLAKNKALLGKW
ncbi:hypothetical protein POM88_037397 [Heracleum sosnowskyi]|uniref:Reverse transcriptase n=1 Tax=Heracleum sosnowskyi TaxID=360622 RepID=A0AAD8HSH3_9APIA|nr:hypothetical protein POM88_037397 [Heracleum sosnowskyi]